MKPAKKAGIGKRRNFPSTTTEDGARRSAKLIALGAEKQAAYEKSFIGKTVEVLVEEDALIGGKTVQTGHTREYMKIALESGENLRNSIVNVQIDNESQIIH